MPSRRDSRAKQAKSIINKTIPAILKGNARAVKGVEAAELFVDPPPTSPQNATNNNTPLRIALQISDTLEVAAQFASSKPETPPKVAILNMASPLRPGGGVLTGATSQEESLCSRTTLYPSLREEFYRLPEVGGVYTPDVLVFGGPQSTPLEKSHWFYVDVVTAAMLRFPDLSSTGLAYAEEKDRELVGRQMRAVMRVLRCKGVNRVVLGAWGCGAYGNPIGEVARAWRRVLMGKGKKAGEGWDGLEVIFAITNAKMAREFATHFGDGLGFDMTVTDTAHDSDEHEGTVEDIAIKE